MWYFRSKIKFRIIFFFKMINRLRFFKIILIQNNIILFFYNLCLLFHQKCIIMNNHYKCVECIRRNRFCVLMFLKFLNRIHEKLKIQLNQIETKQIRLMSKIFRFRKMLKQKKICIIQKIRCVIVKLNNNNDKTKNEIFIKLSSFFQLMNDLFNDFWQLLNDFVVDENFLIFFDNFWNVLWIFTCFSM